MLVPTDPAAESSGFQGVDLAAISMPAARRASALEWLSLAGGPRDPSLRFPQ